MGSCWTRAGRSSPFDGLVFHPAFASADARSACHGHVRTNGARPTVAAERSSARLVDHRDQADTVAVAQW
jgi:hypothetical protein